VTAGYIGCIAMLVVPVSFPVNCEVRFSGVRGDGRVVDVVKGFAPKKPLDPEAEEDMQLVRFGDELKGIGEMRVALESSQLPLGVVTTAIILDSFDATLNSR
jgi:hypothetical protein